MRTMLALAHRLAAVAAIVTLSGSTLHGQGYGQSMTMQGLNDPTLPSVASRAWGGLSLTRTADPSLMFRNPASLNRMDGISVSVSGINRTIERSQDQAWIPLRQFPTFSLMMEGLLGLIDDPDFTEAPDDGFGPEDSIPRPFDSIRPNWSRSADRTAPINITIGMPFEVGGLRFGAGLGMTEYANLDHYFMNTNVLDPSIGSQRPYSVPLPAIGQETPVNWSSRMQSRDGSLYAYGAALSVEATEGLSFGTSFLLIRGSTDDREESIGRARILFGNNNNVYYYRLDSIYAITRTAGTSTYTGLEVSASAAYETEVFSIGIQVRPPTTIERSVDASFSIDTTGTPAVTRLSSSDKLLLPWRGAVSLALQLRKDFVAGIEYEVRPYATAEYTDRTGTITRPWLSSSVFRAGASYRPWAWLDLRAGFREQAMVQAQEGTGLIGEPVRYAIYSTGVGLHLLGFRLDVTYETSKQDYRDMWQTNVNTNHASTRSILTRLSYTLN